MPGNVGTHRTLGSVVAVLVALLAMACSTVPSQEDSSPVTSPSDTTATSSPNAEVFFPTVRPLAAVPSASIRGTLALSEKGCLLIKPPPGNKAKFPGADPSEFRGSVPLWPSNYRLDTGGGEVRVLDEHGRVVAQVGEKVWMGGDGIGEKTLRRNELMGERELRELSEHYPDNYLLVGEGTHIPKQGN